MKETIDKVTSRPPKLAISLNIDSIEQRKSGIKRLSNQSINSNNQDKPSLTLKSIKENHAFMTEYLSKPSPTN